MTVLHEFDLDVYMWLWGLGKLAIGNLSAGLIIELAYVQLWEKGVLLNSVAG